MNRKILLFVLTAASLVVAVVTVALITRGGKVTVYQSKIIARNIRFPELAPDQKILFFTGSAFAKYNPGTNTSTSLTREFSLPPVTAVRWSGKGALVRVEGISPQDELYGQVKTLPASEHPVWWVVNFATNTITPLAASVSGQKVTVTDARWQDPGAGGEYVLTGKLGSSGEQAVFRGGQAGLKPLYRTKGGPDIILVGGYGTRVAIRVGERLLQVDPATGSAVGIAELGPGAGEVLLSPDASSLIYAGPLKNESPQDQQQQRTVHALSLQNQDEQVLGSISDKAVWSLKDRFLLSAVPSQDGYEVKAFNLDSGRASALQAAPGGDQLGEFSNIMLISDDKSWRFFASNAAGDLALYSSSQEEAYKYEGVPFVLFEDKLTYLKEGFMEYDLTRNELLVSLAKKPGRPFHQQQTTALEEIKAFKVDPHQLIKSWRSYEPVVDDEGIHLLGE
ncbi:MAG TPA: hypothetical protein VK963_00180 [Candidatus Saccharimonadales bacterium]|nr:hypothetical protein [Candidatus Saccharimonadales bacterium]